MRPNEGNCARIETECLAIAADCDKWDLWVYGQVITVHTDHQALETHFRKKTLKHVPCRLRNIMMRLQWCQSWIGKSANSDWLWQAGCMDIWTGHHWSPTLGDHFKKHFEGWSKPTADMVMCLQQYKLQVLYQKGASLLVADSLSSVSLLSATDATNFEVFQINLEEDTQPDTRIFSQPLRDIRCYTSTDLVLSELATIIARV